MTTLQVRVICIISAALAPLNLCGQLRFPEWRGSKETVYGEWMASPVVAVGKVSNISSYGEQNVDRLPWPMSPDVHRLYWCQGDFGVFAVVKGELHTPTKRYLWASAFPGCKLWPDDPHLVYSRFQTRAWFLREEGDFLRPTFDAGTRGFIGLFTRWEDGPPSAARLKLGTLLLTPSANSDNLEDYAHYLWHVGDIACELLGKPICAQRIRALGELGSPSLREQACGFLRGQLGQDCGTR